MVGGGIDIVIGELENGKERFSISVGIEVEEVTRVITSESGV